MYMQADPCAQPPAAAPGAAAVAAAWRQLTMAATLRHRSLQPSDAGSRAVAGQLHISSTLAWPTCQAAVATFHSLFQSRRDMHDRRSCQGRLSMAARPCETARAPSAPTASHAHRSAAVKDQ